MFPRDKSYRICVVRYKLPLKTILKSYMPQYCYDSNGKKKNYKRYYFFQGPGLSSMSPAHIKSNKIMQQMV